MDRCRDARSQNPIPNRSQAGRCWVRWPNRALPVHVWAPFARIVVAVGEGGEVIGVKCASRRPVCRRGWLGATSLSGQIDYQAGIGIRIEQRIGPGARVRRRLGRVTVPARILIDREAREGGME